MFVRVLSTVGILTGTYSDRVTVRERIAQRKSSDPTAAQLTIDFHRWVDAPHAANSEHVIHALGLHKDLSRGRTHIVIRMVRYTPSTSKDLRHHFLIESCGVFRIADVMTYLEGCMGLDPGEGQEYLDDLLDDDRTRIPLFTLTVTEKTPSWLGRSKQTISRMSGDD